MTTFNQLTITGAKNADEAKVLVDAYLETLTGEYALNLVKTAYGNDTYHYMGMRISYAIGSCSYYYGAECKHFPAQVIQYEIVNRAVDYAMLIAKNPA